MGGVANDLGLGFSKQADKNNQTHNKGDFRMKKRYLSIFLSLVIIFTFGLSAVASEKSVDEPNLETEVFDIAHESEGVIVYEPSEESAKLENSQFKLPARSSGAAQNKAVVGEKLKKQDRKIHEGKAVSDIAIDSIASIDSASKAEKSSRAPAQTYVEYNLSDTLDFLGDYAAWTVNLGPMSILQAKLSGPQNLSIGYEVSVYELVGGSLALRDECYYPTTAEYIPKQVGVVNNSLSTKTYYIFVDTVVGFSSSLPFALNVTLSDAGSFDILEADENAFTALPLGNTSGNGVVIDRNINCPIENDWYYFNVPSGASYSSLEIQNLSSVFTVENYRVQNGLLVKVGEATSASNLLPVVEGYNYMRIIFNGNAFFNTISNDYTITVKQYIGGGSTPGVVASYKTYIIVNGHCQRFSNEFPDKKTRGLVLDNKSVKFRIEFYDASNQPVATNKRILAGLYNPKFPNNGSDWREGEATANNATFVEIDITSHFRYTGSGYDEIYCVILDDETSEPINGYDFKNMALIGSYNNQELAKACAHGINLCPYW